MNMISSLPTNYAQPPSTKTRIALAEGDGIGPEITDAVLHILREAGAQLEIDRVSVGEAEYLKGISSGIDPQAFDAIRAHGVLLKGPITTPQGGGYKSVNVSLRKTLGLFANVRPCQTYRPWVPSRHPDFNLVIVRENEEDTYGGIEHRQTDEVYQCLKLITRPGCERIVRYAFEYARSRGRKKITCMSKDNIMKMTDGLFHQVFNEVGQQYPDIVQEHKIIDIGAARLAARPESFDVIVTPNLYGDILSDIAAELTGSVGLAGSANIGRTASMFEAIHGSAPDIAGQDKANPSGMLQAAIMMLEHMGQSGAANRIRRAWLQTLGDGIHTLDIASEQYTNQLAGTADFARAVAARLASAEQNTNDLVTTGSPIDMSRVTGTGIPTRSTPKRLVGVDLFIHRSQDRQPESLAAELIQALPAGFELKMISNRGTRVWPTGAEETWCSDHWRCRLLAIAEATSMAELLKVLQAIHLAGLDIIKTENLYQFDGKAGYTLSQGE